MAAQIVDEEKFTETYQGFCINHTAEETREILQAWIEQLDHSSHSLEQSNSTSTEPPVQPISSLIASTGSNSIQQPILPLTPRTVSPFKEQVELQTILTPLKHWIYTQPFPLEHANLNNLYGLESNLPPTPSGFFLIDTGISLTNAPRHPLSQGALVQQSFKRELHGIIVCDTNEDQIALSAREFAIPKFVSSYLGPLGNLEIIFESHLERLENSRIKHEYFIATSHSLNIRRNLGLPAEGLHPGTRLLCTSKHFPGIHSSYIYISSASGSAFPLHVEDFHLNSANILYEGAPKLWIIVDPNSKLRLESRLAERLNIIPTCSQFVRHHYILPQPSLLRQWKVKFQIILQPPGSMVLLQSNTYHHGLNLGSNIAEAINYTDSEWTVPPLYLACHKGKPCYQDPPMRVSDMEIKTSRPLEIDTAWEDPPLLPKVPFTKDQTQTQRSKRAITACMQSLATRPAPKKTGKPEKMTIPKKNGRSVPIASRSLRSNLPNTEFSLSSNSSRNEPASCSKSSRNETTSHSSLPHSESLSDSNPSHFDPLSPCHPSRNTPQSSIAPPSVLGDRECNNLSTKGAGSPRFIPESDTLWVHSDKAQKSHALVNLNNDFLEDVSDDLRESEGCGTQTTSLTPFTTESTEQNTQNLSRILIPPSKLFPIQQSDMSQASDLHCIDQLYEQSIISVRKRPCGGSSDHIKKKILRPVFMEIQTHQYNNRSQNLQKLGQDWEVFYSQQIQTNELLSDEIYRILALVSAIGSPQVLLDLSDLYRSISDQSSETIQMNPIAKAYWLYNHTEAHILCGQVRKRLLMVFIYKQFKMIQDEWQHKLDENRRAKRRKSSDRSEGLLPLGKKPKSATFALDALVQSCYQNNMPIKKEQLHSERMKIQKLKDQGAKFFNFSEYFKAEFESLEIWYLLPIKDIKSPLDEHEMVHYQQYLDLKGRGLEMFKEAIKKLRPKLKVYSLPAGEHDWLVFGSHDHRRAKLKIESMDPNIIAEESLDSELLLTCFELQDTPPEQI